MVPASVRSDDSDVSNRITMILANLGTHKDDPLERLKTVRRSVLSAKERFKRMNANQILNYSAFVYGLAGFNIASGLMPKRQAFNVIISNVPGPQEPLYWNGAFRSLISGFNCTGWTSTEYHHDQLYGQA